MKSKKLIWFLVGLVLLIWGTIAYQLYASMNETDEGLSLPTSPAVSEPSDQSPKYVYLFDVRDPFKFVASIRRDTSRQPKHGAQKWVPPPMKLTGVITAGKRKTAILEASDGSVFFLHEGDTLHGVKLLKIQDQAVSYVYQKKKDEWDLPKQ